MKILVLASRFPYPLEKGDKLRLYNQIKELSKSHQLILVALSDEKVTPEYHKELEAFCEKIFVFRLHKWWVYPKTIWKFLFGGSLQVSYFTSWRLKRKIKRIVYQEKPDHIYCQLIRMAEYVRYLYHIPKTLDYMDAFSIGMMRRAKDSSWLRRQVFREESARLRTYEGQVFYDFDLHTIISDQDRQLIYTPDKQEIRVVPNGVDIDNFRFRDEGGCHGHRLLFVGNMSYYPNIKAAEYLAREVMPLLRKKEPQFKLAIAGANPSQLVQDLAAEDIEVTGWVDDIVEEYHKSGMVVAPIFHGSGLQNKILEAMACGIPVITTLQTNNAIGAKEEKEILIAGEANEFVERIQRLLKDEAAYDAIRGAARTFVERNYSWSVFVNELEKEIKASE